MKLLAKTLHSNQEPSEVIVISKDGWVVTHAGTKGDNGVDCILSVELPLKDLRKSAGLTQSQMAQIIGTSRPTYVAIEQNPSRLTLIQYLALKNTKEFCNPI